MHRELSSAVAVLANAPSITCDGREYRLTASAVIIFASSILPDTKLHTICRH